MINIVIGLQKLAIFRTIKILKLKSNSMKLFLKQNFQYVSIPDKLTNFLSSSEIEKDR